MSECLQPGDLERLRRGVAAESERRVMESHLRGCPRCQAAYDEIQGDTSPFGGGVPDSWPARLDGETEAIREAERAPAGEHLPRIEGYTVLRWIGAGGMAVVYEALQEKLNRRVALKLLPAVAGAAQPRLVERFRREATAAAGLHHTHIIPIYDFGESRDGCYYAMELIHGQTLRTLIKRLSAVRTPDLSATGLAALVRATESSAEGSAPSDTGPNSGSSSSGAFSTSGRGRLYYRQAAQWIADVADALHYAHTCGVIHRDIKPANLILSTDGRIMVADFGLAKTVGEESVTVSGSLIGTYRYMSPEQVGAKRVRVDARTDVYSLGATMYELLTLRPAFLSTEREELLGHILFEDPAPPRKIVPAVPVELQTICQKAMEKSPSARYASAKAMADDLRRFASDLPIVARPVGPIGRAVRFLRRHRAAAITTAVILVLGSALTLTALKAREAQRQRAAADAASRLQRIESLIKQGSMHQDSGDFVQAEKAYQEVLALYPDQVGALWRLAALKKDYYYQTGEAALLKEAEELVHRAVSLQPDSYEALNVRGVILRERGRLPEAEADYRLLTKMDPDSYAAWVNLGTVLAMQGHFDEAEKALGQGVQLAARDAGVGPMPWRNLGALQLHLGKSAAADTLNLALDRPNADVPTRLLLAKLHLTLEGHVDAKAALNKAVSADENSGRDHRDPRVKRVLALAYLRNAQWKDTAESAERAIEFGDACPALAHLIAAVARARLNERGAAQEHLDAARRAWPAELEAKGFEATANKRVLWFETAAELRALRDEAERLLSVSP